MAPRRLGAIFSTLRKYWKPDIWKGWNMLTDSDVGRIEEIMLRITAVREKRGYIPDRDEDKIAEILQRGENAARIQHELLIESNYGFASPIRIRDRAVDSEETRDFSSLSRWKNREIDS